LHRWFICREPGYLLAVSKPYPWFYAVNDRPVQIVELPGGGADILVFDHATGNFVPDRSYYDYVAPGSGKDVDELDARQFTQLVAARRAQVVKKLADRLCAAKGTGEQDVLAALGVTTSPAPLGGTSARVRGGMVPVFEVDLAEGTLLRGELDARLGEAQKLPRTGPGRPHTLSWPVRVDGAPYRCTVFASFDDAPGALTPAKSVMWRLDGV
jgi:hypothetical protein